MENTNTEQAQEIVGNQADAAPQMTESTAQPVAGKNGEGTEVAASGGGSFWIILVLWVAVIYFFFMRPQKKREQSRKQLLEQIQKGDEVITVGGVHGEVVNINNEVVTLKVDSKTGTTMTFSKAAVSSFPKKEQELGLDKK